MLYRELCHFAIRHYTYIYSLIACKCHNVLMNNLYFVKESPEGFTEDLHISEEKNLNECQTYKTLCWYWNPVHLLHEKCYLFIL